MPFCPKCGARTAKDDEFCRECGTRMVPIAPPTKPAPPKGKPAPPKPREKAPKMPKERSSTLTAGGILAIIAAFFCIMEGIVGLYFVFGFIPLMFGIVGLYRGKLALEKTGYSLLITNLVVMLIIGGLTMLLGLIAYYRDLITILGIIVGGIILLLSILGIAFIMASKHEFVVEKKPEKKPPRKWSIAADTIIAATAWLLFMFILLLGSITLSSLLGIVITFVLLPVGLYTLWWDWKREVKKKLEKPLDESAKTEEKVFKYIKKHSGAIEKERCMKDLGMTEKQFKTTIRSLQKAGKLRSKK